MHQLATEVLGVPPVSTIHDDDRKEEKKIEGKERMHSLQFRRTLVQGRAMPHSGRIRYQSRLESYKDI